MEAAAILDLKPSCAIALHGLLQEISNGLFSLIVELQDSRSPVPSVNLQTAETSYRHRLLMAEGLSRDLNVAFLRV